MILCDLKIYFDFPPFLLLKFTPLLFTTVNCGNLVQRFLSEAKFQYLRDPFSYVSFFARFTDDLRRCIDCILVAATSRL